MKEEGEYVSTKCHDFITGWEPDYKWRSKTGDKRKRNRMNKRGGLSA